MDLPIFRQTYLEKLLMPSKEGESIKEDFAILNEIKFEN